MPLPWQVFCLCVRVVCVFMHVCCVMLLYGMRVLAKCITVDEAMLLAYTIAAISFLVVTNTYVCVCVHLFVCVCVCVHLFVFLLNLCACECLCLCTRLCLFVGAYVPACVCYV